MSIIDVLSKSGFSASDIKSPNQNKNSNEVKGDTPDDKPYEQFEMCRHKEGTEGGFKCKYIDNSGRCTHEYCLQDYDPPKVSIWYFKCLICGREDTCDPKEQRAPFCRKCIERMNKAGWLPHHCSVCGRSINGPTKFMFSGMCDDCANALSEVIKYWKGHKRWRHSNG